MGGICFHLYASELSSQPPTIPWSTDVEKLEISQLIRVSFSWMHLSSMGNYHGQMLPLFFSVFKEKLKKMDN